MSMLDRLAKAREDLLDLGLRNPLIHHRLPRVRGIKMEGTVAALLAMLAGDEAVAIRAADEKSKRGAGIMTTYSELELDKRLLATSRQARLAMEERGAHVLHIAIGYVVWRDKDDEERLAPLMFLPVMLSKHGERWRLSQVGDGDVTANVCLLAMLRRDGIQIPSQPEDDDPLTQWSRFCASVQAAIEERGWRVEPDRMTIDTFIFSTFLMYRDLEPQAWPSGELEKNPLLESTLGKGFTAQDILTPGQIAELRSPLACRDVVEADGTQAAVLAEIAMGRSLVVQGPPGTGKSQTITNLIAEAVGNGKTVLFVAEKQAALQVVMRRMEKLGLGAMCLMVASDQVSRRQIANTMRQVLDMPEPTKGEDSAILSQELLKVSKQLTQVTVDESTPQVGLSPVSAVSRWADFEQHSHSKLCDPDELALISEEQWPTVVLAAEALVSACHKADTSTRLFSESSRSLVGPVEERQARQLLRAAQASAQALEEPWQRIVKALGLADFNEPLDQNIVCAFAVHMISAPEVPWHDSVWDNVSALVNAHELWLASERARIDAPLAPGVSLPPKSELTELQTQLQAYGQSVFKFLSPSWRSARNRLRELCGNAPSDQAGCLNIVKRLLLRSHIEEQLKHVLPLLRAAAPGVTEPFDNDVLIKALQWRKTAPIVSNLVYRISQRWDRAWLTSIEDPRKLFAVHQDNLDRLRTLLMIDSPSWRPTIDRLECLEQSVDRWQDWVAIRLARQQLMDLGATKTGQMAVDAPDCRDLVPAMQCQRAIRILEDVCSRPSLAGLDGQSHEVLRQRYVDLDKRWLLANRARIALLHYRGLPRANDNDPQAIIVRREAEKKGRHLPLRELLTRAGKAFLRTKPVLCMSPSAVAAHLPPGLLNTDLVVFDEASQVRPVEALGALLRGKQAIVVGDSRQMPPTAFFRSVEQDDGESSDHESSIEAPATQDMESVLGLFVAQGAPSRMLRWHYRSRHPDLIAVSNAACYEHQLRLFPCPPRHQDLGLRYVHLPESVYDRAESRTNPIEAAALVSAVKVIAIKFPRESIGIVAFSLAQAQCIENLIDQELRSDLEFASFWNSHPTEPAFVKNLESVQGDERDSMFISVGYGRDKERRLAMQFGPVSADGGQRRLNVLISRSRRRQYVFTNLSPEDLSAATAPGVVMLRQFLAASRDGLTTTAHHPAPTNGLFGNLVNGLRCGQSNENPMLVVPGLGLTFQHHGLFNPIDLGPESQIRDRERLFSEVMTNLGWIIHRLHPTLWWRRRDKEQQRLMKLLGIFE